MCCTCSRGGCWSRDTCMLLTCACALCQPVCCCSRMCAQDEALLPRAARLKAASALMSGQDDEDERARRAQQRAQVRGIHCALQYYKLGHKAITLSASAACSAIL